MSLAALAQERFWENKAQCEDAEKAYYMRLSGAKAKGSSPSSLAAEIAKARQHIKNSLECVDGIEAMAGGAGDGVLKKLKDLELENKDLKKVTNDLKAMVLKLENRVASLEKAKPAGAAAPAPAKAAPAPAADDDDDDDDDVDLFGSDSESEDDEEKKKRTEERLKAYHAKKSTKKAVIAKTSVCLDIKPWDDETDMNGNVEKRKNHRKRWSRLGSLQISSCWLWHQQIANHYGS